eukprot:scaffold28117_cov64-Phaeocystis_antarctica.AAC.15
MDGAVEPGPQLAVQVRVPRPKPAPKRRVGHVVCASWCLLVTCRALSLPDEPIDALAAPAFSYHISVIERLRHERAARLSLDRHRPCIVNSSSHWAGGSSGGDGCSSVASMPVPSASSQPQSTAALLWLKRSPACGIVGRLKLHSSPHCCWMR